MAYDQAFLRVTWGFFILNTDEIALTGLNLSHPTDPTFNAAAALAEINMATVGPLLIARMQTLMSTAALRWADYSRQSTVRIADVSALGVEGPLAKEFEDVTPAAGTASSIPPQASIVVSTRSGLTTGSANFGRMYLPHTAFGLGTPSPFATSVDAGAVATAAQTFVNGVNDDLNAVVTESISAMIMTQVVGGTSKKINQVATGNVTDTQRRRRNALPETYQFRAIP